MNRWLWFLVLVVIVGLIGWLAVFGLSNPPIPQPVCNPQALIPEQRQAVADLARWLRARELVVALSLALLLFSLFYLQVVHTVPLAAANIIAVTIIFVVSSVAAWAVWSRVSTWEQLQRPTCLSEALGSPQATGMSFLGSVFGQNAWLMAVTVEAFVWALLGALVGWAGYLGARRVARL